jgi:hypothetical protein
MQLHTYLVFDIEDIIIINYHSLYIRNIHIIDDVKWIIYEQMPQYFMLKNVNILYQGQAQRYSMGTACWLVNDTFFISACRVGFACSITGRHLPHKFVF